MFKHVYHTKKGSRDISESIFQTIILGFKTLISVTRLIEKSGFWFCGHSQ